MNLIKSIAFLTFVLIAIPHPASAAWVFNKNCSATQKKAINDATTGLLAWSKAGVDAVDSVIGGKAKPSSTAYTQYVKWFGKYDKDRAATVKQNLEAIQERLQDKTKLSAECDAPRCDPTDYAATTFGMDYILFCSRFWGAPDVGQGSKKGTILHELSHQVVNTRDHVYSPADAAKLAVSNIPQALNNADNYEFFIEAINEK